MIRYVVRAGDTLTDIARRFGTTVQAIMAANNLADPNFLVIGQVLFIPVGDTIPQPPRPPQPPQPPQPPRPPQPPQPPQPPRPPQPPQPPSPPSPGRPTVTRTFDGVEYTLSLNKSRYRIGENIIIRLRKRNILRVPLTLTYRTSQRVDFRVTRDNRPIWQWSTGRFFTPAAGSDTLQPGESKTYRLVWNQRADSTLLRPGRYTLTGWNLATPSIRLSLDFEIERR